MRRWVHDFMHACECVCTRLRTPCICAHAHTSNRANATITFIQLRVIFYRHLITLTDVGLVQGLAVYPGAGKLYFSIFHEGKVEVANLNGSGRETFISRSASSEAMGIALDLTDG